MAEELYPEIGDHVLPDGGGEIAVPHGEQALDEKQQAELEDHHREGGGIARD